MSMSSIPSHSPTGKLYGWVEKIGNKVPHPFLLFIYLIVALMAATAILSALNVGVQNPTDGSRVVVKNLLSVEGLHWFLPNVIKNFSGFAPLGAILALVLGAGFAERVGLLPSLMVKMSSHVSARYASYMVLFIAFFSHISSDAALVIMPPLGALMFLAVGRHPVAGLLAAIAGVAADSRQIYSLSPPTYCSPVSVPKRRKRSMPRCMLASSTTGTSWLPQSSYLLWSAD